MDAGDELCFGGFFMLVKPEDPPLTGALHIILHNEFYKTVNF